MALRSCDMLDDNQWQLRLWQEGGIRVLVSLLTPSP